MTYAAVEVQLRNGRVIPRVGESLPVSARALLVVLETETASGEENRGDVSQTLSRIRARQLARGYSPRSAEAVGQQLREDRESWD